MDMSVIEVRLQCCLEGSNTPRPMSGKASQERVARQQRVAKGARESKREREKMMGEQRASTKEQ